MSKTFVASADPNYSVTVYPREDYPHGSGWYIHTTDMSKTFSCDELFKATGNRELTDELVGIGNFVAWGD